MARGFLSFAMQAARAAERAQRARIRDAERLHREHSRVAKELARQDKRIYVDTRIAEVENLNTELEQQTLSIERLLTDSISSPPQVRWESMLRHVRESDLDGISSLNLDVAPVRENFLPAPLGRFKSLFYGLKQQHAKAVADGEVAFKAAEAAYQTVIKLREEKLTHLREEAQRNNSEVKSFRLKYESRERDAVVAFFDILFSGSDFPEQLSGDWKISYIPESRQLICEFDLPTLDEAIPVAERYRYNKAADDIVEMKKAVKIRHGMYSSLIAQIVLRRLNEIFAGDRARVVDVAVISAFVNTNDPATGQDVRPCLVSVRASRDEFESFDLGKVTPLACLTRLSASFSRSPAELAPVKPIVDINMSDPRFIQEVDILSTLDSRPNLMELSPGEFENLITNLFQKMGLETKLTQASRDGGVDCVAFDTRPVLGGKVVVQAKRYKNTVGVSAVRDLFGTMHNEGASKGILVTTSGYGKAAATFANNKPIELISGSNLLYLLKQHAGIDAKIVVPDNWRDPIVDDYSDQ